MKPETFEKIKKLESLSHEEKVEMLEDTQRAGFNPVIHQVRSNFDLIDAIKKFNTQSSIYSAIILIATLMMLFFVVIQLLVTVRALKISSGEMLVFSGLAFVIIAIIVLAYKKRSFEGPNN